MTQKSLNPPAKGNQGPKPTLLDDLERSKIISSIEGGGGRVMSCRVNKIDYRRFLRTMREDRDFAREVEASDQFKREIALAMIFDGVKGGSEKSSEIYLNQSLKIVQMSLALAQSRSMLKLKEREVVAAEGGKRHEGRPDVTGLDDRELDIYERYNAGEEMTDEEYIAAAKIGRRVLQPRVGGAEAGDPGGAVQA